MLNRLLGSVAVPRNRLALLSVLVVLLAACGRGPTDSGEVTKASDLRGHRYVAIPEQHDLEFRSGNKVGLVHWINGEVQTGEYTYEDDNLHVDFGEGFELRLRKSSQGGWIGRSPVGPLTYLPESEDTARQRTEHQALVAERERLLAERPPSEGAYHPLESEIDWRMLYASRATHMSDEELAAFLIPGYGNERDAFRKRELFSQLEALKPEIETWRARRFFRMDYGRNAPIRGYPSVNAYSFETQGFGLSTLACQNMEITMPGNVRVRPIAWEDEDACVVRVTEAEAREVESLRTAHRLEIDTTAYLHLIPGETRSLDFDVHHIDVRFSRPVLGRFSARVGAEEVAQSRVSKP